MTDYLWLVKTPKGNYFVSVVGNWTEEEAAKLLHKMFSLLPLTILEMVKRKLATGDLSMGVTIVQNPKDKSDISFLAGQGLHEAMGLTALYEAQSFLWKRVSESKSS